MPLDNYSTLTYSLLPCQVLQLINRPAPGSANDDSATSTNLLDDAEAASPRKPNGTANPSEPEEWGEFLHLPGQKIFRL